jgi:hypothetical protein
MDKLIPATRDKKNPKYKEIQKFSNVETAQKKAYELYRELGTLYLSTKKDKKFMIFNPKKKKFIHFGQMGMEDFNKHKDPERLESYLRRSLKIKGDWRKDIYSPNNLSIFILW